MILQSRQKLTLIDSLADDERSAALELTDRIAIINLEKILVKKISCISPECWIGLYILTEKPDCSITHQDMRPTGMRTRYRNSGKRLTGVPFSR